MKKFIPLIILVVVLIIGGAYYMLNQKEEKTNETQSAETKKESKKILVVYYSAQSHTKAVAEKIADNLDADVFEIVPKNVYTEKDLDWTDDNSRVVKEHDDVSLRDVELESTKANNWDDYDTVLVGYPIWWTLAAWPVNSFVKANDFSGKTVIPFCTSASSGIGDSGKLLEKETNTGKWLSGERFSSNPSNKDIKAFTDSIK